MPFESTFAPAVASGLRGFCCAAVGAGVRGEALSGVLATRGADGCGVLATVPRGGQMTPSHPRSLHLKSGAFGLRFPSRLSHISPPHLGQLGTAEAASVAWSSDMQMRRRWEMLQASCATLSCRTGKA